MIKCPECGMEIEKNVEECPECGCPVEELDMTVNVLEEENNKMPVITVHEAEEICDKPIIGESKYNKSPKKRLNNKKKAIFVVLGIILLIVVVFLAFFIPNNQKYNKAITAAQDGEYINAIKILEEIGDFRDSKDKHKEYIDKLIDSTNSYITVWTSYIGVSADLSDNVDVSKEDIDKIEKAICFGVDGNISFKTNSDNRVVKKILWTSDKKCNAYTQKLFLDLLTNLYDESRENEIDTRKVNTWSTSQYEFIRLTTNSDGKILLSWEKDVSDVKNTNPEVLKREFILNLLSLEISGYAMAIQSEKVCKLTTQVWYNAIYDRYNSETLKYTSSASNFDEALVNLYNDTETILRCAKIKDYKEELQSTMRNLSNPPDGLEMCYEAALDYHSAINDLADLALNPQGSYNSFSNEVNEKIGNCNSTYNKLSVLVPELETETSNKT